MAEVVLALQRTEKGQLDYRNQLDSCSLSERTQILDQLTEVPPISFKAVQHRIHALTLTDSPNSSSESSQIGEHEEQSIKAVPTCIIHRGLPEVKSPLKQAEEEAWEYSQSVDDDIMSAVEATLQQKRKLFRADWQRIQQEHCNQYRMQRLIRDAERELEREEERALEEEWMNEVEREIARKNQEYEQHARSIKERVHNLQQDMKLQMRQLEEKKKEEIRQLKHQCRQLAQEAVNLYRQFDQLLRGCRYSQLIPQLTLSQVQEAQKLAQEVIKGCNEQGATDDPQASEVNKLRATLSGILPSLADVKEAVDEANHQGAEQEKQRNEELQRKAEEERKRAEEERQRDQEQRKKDQEQAEKETKLPNSSSSLPTDASQRGVIGPAEALSWYQSLEEKLHTAIEGTTDLVKTTNSQLKKYRIELVKAVNTPVCAISAISGSFLIEKIQHLKQLLNGDSVEMGMKRVSIKEHPQAGLYCTNHLAKKLVKQGEEQANAESAFPIAGVIVHLWAEFPHFGELFLAHCHATCPILVPMYFKRLQGMSEVEFLQVQGYKLTLDGVIEKDDLYLKRMAAVVRLYAAVLQTQPLLQAKPHPHGLNNGWTWLARVLNTDPECNITATALYAFLEVSGNAMFKRFGWQFTKLLRVLITEYIPKIKKITPETEMGPFARLQEFLEKTISQGQIPEPKGVLSQAFWRSRTSTSILKA